jgi:hypothetical protein
MKIFMNSARAFIASGQIKRTAQPPSPPSSEIEKSETLASAAPWRSNHFPLKLLDPLP